MSMLKTRGSELQQEISELALRVSGMAGCITRATGQRSNAESAADGFHAADHYLNMRKVSIYGGSNEIQRGIIAKHALGL